jgi:hemerythrin-like domain-containing protein
VKKRKAMTRRKFLAAGALAAGGVEMCYSAEDSDAVGGEKLAISPPEDLMREHGVLRRLLLVYDKYISEYLGSRWPALEPLMDTAKLIHTFVENYHEKLEEDYVFPSFMKAGKMVELVDLLAVQHNASRRLTEIILSFGRAENFNEESQGRLVECLQQFVRMYRPHAAWEDTVLFPALHETMSEKAYQEMGDIFEEREHELFGPEGFQNVVEQTASIEKMVGIYGLERFTPTIK